MIVYISYYQVEESMENILFVIKERDRAYNLLETGETNEPQPVWRKNILGLWQLNAQKEHYHPKHKDSGYMKALRWEFQWPIKYKKLYRERQIRKFRRARRIAQRKQRDAEEAYGKGEN